MISKKQFLLSLLTMSITTSLTFTQMTVAQEQIGFTSALKEEDHIEIMNDLTGNDIVAQEEEENKIDIDKAVETVKKTVEEKKPKLEYYKALQTLYTTETCMLRKAPNDDAKAVTQLKAGSEIIISGKVKNSNYLITTYDGKVVYIKDSQVNEDQWYFTYNHDWDGAKLNTKAGVVLGPQGYESYYNLPMSGVISIMRSMGYSEEEYPYWVREDGAKMLGDYIMVAANLSVYPRGTKTMCSLGQCIVCDTGGFIHSTNRVFDVAVSW